MIIPSLETKEERTCPPRSSRVDGLRQSCDAALILGSEDKGPHTKDVTAALWSRAAPWMFILVGNPNHFRRQGAVYALRALFRGHQPDLIKIVAGFSTVLINSM